MAKKSEWFVIIYDNISDTEKTTEILKLLASEFKYGHRLGSTPATLFMITFNSEISVDLCESVLGALLKRKTYAQEVYDHASLTNYINANCTDIIEHVPPVEDPPDD